MVLVPLSQTTLPSFAAEEIGTETGQNIVNIPDPELKAALNSLRGKPLTENFTETEMLGFNGFVLSGNITDLTGLEYAKNVNMLVLDNISATNYEQITKLPELTNLTIKGANVTSSAIPDLSGLTKLTSMYVTDSNIDNSVYPKINNIPNLSSLSLTNNKKITNVTDLKSSPNLTTLNVENCQVTDYRGVQDFPRLTSFNGGQQKFAPEGASEIKSSTLNYNAKAQTMFIPFSIMTPSALTNFDGSKITPSFRAYESMVILNTGSVPDSKMVPSKEGITITGMTPADFDKITSFSLYTVFDVRDITTPANLTPAYYNLKNSAGMENFTVDHSVNITSEDSIKYIAGETVTPEKFLTD
ncbi:TPA: leucine-rich repeat domain-containing protein, partial [Listeria monocytogenes]|nr:leucine-rich repeat domain-containing protein [Listeria monocytogenes]